MYEKICQLVESLKIGENGGLSEQAELNLKTGRSDLFPCPLKGSCFLND